MSRRSAILGLIGSAALALPAAAPLEARLMKEPAGGSIELPAGARMLVRLDEGLYSARTRQGEEFTAVLVKGVYWGRHTVFPEGSKVNGIVTEVRRPKMGLTKASITIVFDRVETPDGRNVPIAAGIPGDFDLGGALAQGGAYAGKMVARNALNTAAKGLLTPLYVADSARRGIQFIQEDKEVAIPAGTVLEVYLHRPALVPL